MKYALLCPLEWTQWLQGQGPETLLYYLNALHYLNHHQKVPPDCQVSFPCIAILAAKADSQFRS